MSLRRRIDAHCRDCVYDPHSGGGTWREQVAQCTVPVCALWPIRAAPCAGPYANPPRDPSGVAPEWLSKPVGWAKSGHPSGDHSQERSQEAGAV